MRVRKDLVWDDRLYKARVYGCNRLKFEDYGDHSLDVQGLVETEDALVQVRAMQWKCKIVKDGVFLGYKIQGLTRLEMVHCGGFYQREYYTFYRPRFIVTLAKAFAYEVVAGEFRVGRYKE